MLQLLAILALTIGGTMLVIGGAWHFRLTTWDDPDPTRLLGSWVRWLRDLEKWQLYWRPVALQLIGFAILVWGWSAVRITS